MFRGKQFYKGPLAGRFYEALKLETKRCVDEGIIQNVDKTNEDAYNVGYRDGAVFFEVTYTPIIPREEATWGTNRQVRTLRLECSTDNRVSVKLMLTLLNYSSLSYNYFPIGDERVQSNLNESFRYWLSIPGGIISADIKEEYLDSYLNSLPRRRTGLQFTYMPSSLQWPNRVQGATSSQFQTNYLSPSSFISPYSSYYSYR